MNTMYFQKPFAIKKVYPKYLWPIAVMGFLSLFAGCSLGGDSGKDKLKVSAVYPLEGATSVGASEFVSARFSEKLKAETITASTFTVTANDVPVEGTVTYDAATKTAQFSPAAPLAPNTLYLATLTKAIKSNDGVALSKVKNWSFTTAEAGNDRTLLDVTKPTVSSTLPLENATAVSSTGDISVTFSEAMLASSITATSFTLTDYLGVAIPGAVSTVGSVATFNPTDTLSSGTVYTATVTTVVADLAGNTLAVDKVWSFTTNNAGPAAISLRTAGNYVILAESGITNAITATKSQISGNVGLNAAFYPNITGFTTTIIDFPLGSGQNVYAIADEVVGGGKIYASTFLGGTTAADLTQASADCSTAYTAAAGCPSVIANTNIGDGDLGVLAGTKTFVPGVYTWTSFVTISDNITLKGGADDVWIFQVNGTLNVASAKNIILEGGAQAKNIFWQITGATTLGTYSHFEGIILCHEGIALQTGATMNGRALSHTAVTLDLNTLTQPAN